MRRLWVICIGSAALMGVALALWYWFADGTSAPSSSHPVVRVAAAADLKFALEDLTKEFRTLHPNIDVQVTFGSSGNFFSQLSNHAPFDLFLSADVDYPRKLIELGLADKQSEFLYAVGHLVVWVPNSSSLNVKEQGMAVVLDPAVKKIAVANPRHAPYGRAAEAALKSLGYYDKVQEKLVLGDNIAQTAQFVQSGSADVGLIALSLAIAPAMRDQGRFWEVPLDAYPRLEQGGVILSWVQDRQAAESFRTFLLSGDGKAVLRRFGFFLAGE
jgi:molybdate transport system substrate-binding protein